MFILMFIEHCIDVYNFLKKINLTEHIETFISNGFEEMEVFMGKQTHTNQLLTFTRT